MNDVVFDFAGLHLDDDVVGELIERNANTLDLDVGLGGVERLDLSLPGIAPPRLIPEPRPISDRDRLTLQDSRRREDFTRLGIQPRGNAGSARRGRALEHGSAAD